MAIHKVIEVISQSETSWEDAAQRAVSDAARTVEQIKSIWVKNFEAVVKNNKIVEYRGAHGAFKRAEDVRKVEGLGDALWERNKDRIVVK